MSEGGSSPCLHIRRYGLLRFTRNDKINLSAAANQPDGQITKSLSSPPRKNISLAPSGKSGV
jgi:hypothetical protein